MTNFVLLTFLFNWYGFFASNLLQLTPDMPPKRDPHSEWVAKLLVTAPMT